jgi:hypothetical protein
LVGITLICIFDVQTLKLNEMITIGFWGVVGIILGAIMCPIFTLGVVLVVIGNTTIGWVLITISIIDWLLTNKEKN